MEDKDLAVIEVTATRLQIEEFIKSPLWKDIKRECEAWLKGFDIELNSIVDDAASTNPSSASVLMHIGDINGRKKAISYLLKIPDTFLEYIAEKAGKEPDNNEEVSNE